MANNFQDENLSDEYPQDLPQPSKVLWHPEKARMKLAYWVLAGIFTVFILTIFVNFLAKVGYLDESLSSSLFEFCKTGLLPIVTLILGYYFSKN